MPQPNPKRLLLIASYNRSIILFRKDLLLEFRKKGYEILAVAHNDAPDVQATLQSLGISFQSVPVSRTGLNPFKDLIFLNALIRIMRTYKPSCILAYTIKPVIYGAMAARVFKRAEMYALITGLGYLETEGGGGLKKLIRKGILTLYRFAMRNVNGVIFQNTDDRDYFISNKLIRHTTPTKVVNGSGVNMSLFEQAAPVKKPVTFMLIARLIHAKGVGLYLEAAKQIKAKHPAVEFHLVGQLDAENPDSIRQDELHSAIDSGIITFHGFQNDVRSLLGKSSVFVLPSYYREGVPRTILEAMAMGKPVITTDNTGCRETVEQEVNGFLIEKKKLEPLIDAMNRFIDNPELIEQMGNASLKIARDKFDVERVNQEMLNFMNVR